MRQSFLNTMILYHDPDTFDLALGRGEITLNQEA